MKKEPLISFEEAKRGKEYGFDTPTKYGYFFDGTICSDFTPVNYNASKTSLYSAPTQLEYKKWFADRKLNNVKL